MTWIGWALGLMLAGGLLAAFPGDQGFIASMLLGGGCAGLGMLIGMAADRA